jgi:hypothetical protein
MSKKKWSAGGMAQVVECLLSNYKFKLSIAKKKEKKKRKRIEWSQERYTPVSPALKYKGKRITNLKSTWATQ